MTLTAVHPLHPHCCRAKLDALASHLGVPQSKLHGCLRSNPHVLTVELQGTLVPRVSLVTRLLLGGELPAAPLHARLM